MTDQRATGTSGVKARVAAILRGWAERLAPERREVLGQRTTLLAEYVTTVPTPQNAVDCVPGWNTPLPPEANAVAGTGFHYFNDPRIYWAAMLHGALTGARVLELGPLEASHTIMLHRLGAASIDAVEANRLAFLRCLIVKELVGLPNAHFHLGDFVAWVDAAPKRYDLVIASGVLYHLADPITFIETLARRTDALYIWTHYLDDTAMPDGDPRRGALVGEVRTTIRHGLPIRTIQRSYHQSWTSAAFCGGVSDDHVWIYRDDLLKLLAAVGLDDIHVEHDEPAHANGPACSIYARRRPVALPDDLASREASSATTDDAPSAAPDEQPPA